MSDSIEYFIIMTVEKPRGGGQLSGTFQGVATTEQAGQTRAEMFTWMCNQVPPELQGGSIVFFSAEPNRVGGAA